MQFVLFDEEKELAAVGLVLIIMVDSGGVPIKHPNVFPMEQDVVDDFSASCPVHTCCRFFPPT
jgi:hypothetical protein